MKEVNFFQITKLLLLLAATFGYVGCSHAPAQSALSADIPTTLQAETKPAVAEPQPSVDELLAQIAPPESCLNTLKNIRFALDTELFNRPEFHTEENMRRFFGQWYQRDEDSINKPKGLRVDRGYYVSNKRKYPLIPCFEKIRLFEALHRLPSGNIENSIYFIGRPLKSTKFYDRHNNIQFDDFLASFGPMNLESVQNCGHALSSSAIAIYFSRRMSLLKEAIDDFQKDMTPHAYGECVLKYKFKATHFDVYVTIYTYRDASIAQLEFYTETRGK